MKLLKFVFIFILLNSCGNAINEKSASTKKVLPSKQKKTLNKKSNVNKKKEIIDSIKSKDGIDLLWVSKGDEKDRLKSGDVVLIDYLLTLKDGTLIHSNRSVKAKQVPFMVGYNMQTKGWDLALEKMHVGDEAKVIIPPKLAYGKKGFGKLIPKNASNLLAIRILSKLKPSIIHSDFKTWNIVKADDPNSLPFNEGKRITAHILATTPSNSSYINTLKNKKPLTFNFNDPDISKSLNNALKNVRSGQQIFVLIPSIKAKSKKAYNKGVKKSESIFYKISVLSVKPYN